MSSKSSESTLTTITLLPSEVREIRSKLIIITRLILLKL